MLILCSRAGLRPAAGLTAEARGFLQVWRLALALRSRCCQGVCKQGKTGNSGTVRCDEFVALASVLSPVCMERLV